MEMLCKINKQKIKEKQTKIRETIFLSNGTQVLVVVIFGENGNVCKSNKQNKINKQCKINKQN